MVHYPKHMAGQLPLVVQAHGSWLACTDPTAQAWACDKGTPEPSYRGYDYLGEQLAKRGFITVSLSADGINMVSFDYGDRARLVNEHLRLWQQLASGKGPLARRLPALSRHVDMYRVGTMGHSRGGKGVMWEASDKHSSEVPDGVRIAAVLALVPVKFDDLEGDHSDTLVTHAACDAICGWTQQNYNYIQWRGWNRPDRCSGSGHSVPTRTASSADRHRLAHPRCRRLGIHPSQSRARPGGQRQLVPTTHEIPACSPHEGHRGRGSRPSRIRLRRRARPSCATCLNEPRQHLLYTAERDHSSRRT
ncbi:hypothetical protein [Streptomyces sp. NPDC004680]|uniref:hypothetical protein n=1 Tax=Streptomyces sp. NPDC004680 TaxID=3154287 RepID=UPI00339FD753